MITIQGVSTIHGEQTNLYIPSKEEKIISAEGLIVLPAVIDPHVHFRTPGLEYKEDWRTGAKAAIRGGCTMVFDMPNTKPPTFTAMLLEEKKALIDLQLKEVGISLRYDLFFGADKQHLNEISRVKHSVIGIKVFMGCSTGNLVIDDDESLHAVFSIAAKENMLVAVHAEDEHLIRKRKANFSGKMDYPVHSSIRNIEVATTAVAKAIELTRRYGTRLYILHVSSAEEVTLIKKAKREGLPVFAETTPHHLFFDTSAYETLGGRAVVNPPLRDKSNHEALFAAIHDKTIDTIGSDHAPHTLDEKSKIYGECPSGMPGIEFMLPLLLNAYHQKRLSLEQIVLLTSGRARDIFNIPAYDDCVLVDLNKIVTITKTESKCGWTPYAGQTLQGWPIHTILNGRCYSF
ncbi:MAG: dihydroorotase [Gammaproteobacteria bacterium]|nr:dihydroorotase [Gammaproteobacteria bacterium]MCW5582744.1 dihydroorotase [Gammaproteobacteria bacterium]